MGHSKPDKGALDWVDILQQGNIEKGCSKPSGKGWQTMAQIIKCSPFGECKTRAITNKMVKAGEIEVFQGTEVNSYGRIVRRVWYRVK